MNARALTLAVLGPALAAAAPCSAIPMTSATQMLLPGDVNSGGEDDVVSAASYSLGSALGEAVVGPRQTSASSYQLGDGLRQIMAFPNAATGLSAVGAAPIGNGQLSWSAPGYDGTDGALQPGTSYYVAVATFVVASPFSPFNGLLVTVSTSGAVQGAAQQWTVSGLAPSTSYFVEVWTVDADGDASLASSTAAFTTLGGAIASLLAAAGLKNVALTWMVTGPGVASFHVYRSTDNVSYVNVATTTAAALLDRPLVSYATYYYKVAPVSGSGLEGGLTAAVSTVPYTLPPLVPIGLVVTPGPTTVTVSWSTTTRFSDGTVFFSTSSPAADELLGYSVYRSTGIASPLTLLGNHPLGSVSHTDSTGGASYFYRVQSYNSLSASTAAVVFDSLGQVYSVASDGLSYVSLDPNAALALNAASNGLGDDIVILAERRPQDTGRDIMQSVGFKALIGGAAAMPAYYLPKPARFVLHYATVNGLPVPSSVGLSALGPGDLGMYWNNGAGFQKMYGKVDELNQVVAVDSPNLGIYQVRSIARASGVVFDVSNVSSRVITPNGDGLNDTFILTYDPGPSGVVPEGKIYDASGRYVADMRPGLVPNTLIWDGRMGGRFVKSGVYVYQVKGDGKVFNGTIVAAR